MGHRSGDRDPIRISVVGHRRVPGLRGAAEPDRASPASAHIGFVVVAPVARMAVPVPRRNQGVQPPRNIGGTRSPEQRRGTGLRAFRQSNRALDWIRAGVGQLKSEPSPGRLLLSPPFGHPTANTLTHQEPGLEPTELSGQLIRPIRENHEQRCTRQVDRRRAGAAVQRRCPDAHARGARTNTGRSDLDRDSVHPCP